MVNTLPMKLLPQVLGHFLTTGHAGNSWACLLLENGSSEETHVDFDNWARDSGYSMGPGQVDPGFRSNTGLLESGL